MTLLPKQPRKNNKVIWQVGRKSFQMMLPLVAGGSMMGIEARRRGSKMTTHLK